VSYRASLSPADIEAGEVACQLLSGRVWADHASTLHAEVIDLFERNGFSVEAEYQVKQLCGYGRRRIDLVAEQVSTGGRIAIEFDCRTPRRKSVQKLLKFPGFRIVGIRGVEGHAEFGIDRCVAMRVRVATPAEKADRRIFRKPVWADDWKGA
jgi:hypothetical protein